MYDPKGKSRDLRRAYYTGQGFSLRKQFDRENPELANSWTHRYNYYDLQDQWICEKIGISCCDYYGSGSIPSWFRRGLNRSQRNYEKQALRDLVANSENFEDFALQRNRRSES